MSTQAGICGGERYDKDEESALIGAYRYIIEVENAKGITERQLKKIKAIPEVRCLGCFNTAEKQP